MTTQELLEQKVRESGSLVERLESCRARIAAMCKEGRPPKMTIPVQWNDDDFFISVTLKDAEQSLHLTGGILPPSEPLSTLKPGTGIEYLSHQPTSK